MNDEIQQIQNQLQREARPVERIRLLLRLADKIRPHDPQSGLNFIKEARILAEQMGEKNLVAQALIHESASNRLLRKYDLALRLANKALEYLPAPSYTRAMGCLTLGVIYHDLGAYDSALEYYFAAVQLKEHLHDPSKVGEWLTNIGNTYLNLKDAENALRFSQEGLEICERYDDIQGASDALSILGTIHAQLNNDNRQALQCFFRCLELRDSLGGRYNGKGSVLNNIASTYVQDRQYTEAEKYYKEALAWERHNENQSLRANALCGLADCLISRKREAPEALQLLREAQRIVQQSPRLPMALTIHELFTKCYKLLGDYKMALEYHEKYLHIHQEIFHKESDRRVLALTVSYDLEKAKNSEILARKEKESALKEQEILRLKNEELSNALREIRELNAQLVRLNAEKNDVMDIVAHNLQNPLAGIRSIATVLIERHTSIDAHALADQLHSIEQGSRAMLATVTDLLDGHALDRGANPN